MVARRRGKSNHKMSSRVPYQILEYGIPLWRATQVSIAERRGKIGASIYTRYEVRFMSKLIGLSTRTITLRQKVPVQIESAGPLPHKLHHPMMEVTQAYAPPT